MLRTLNPFVLDTQWSTERESWPTVTLSVTMTTTQNISHIFLYLQFVFNFPVIIDQTTQS